MCSFRGVSEQIRGEQSCRSMTVPGRRESPTSLGDVGAPAPSGDVRLEIVLGQMWS